MKKVFDTLFSAFGLLLTSPILLPVIFLVWWTDKHTPFYIAQRVGLNGKPFKMVKLRSMVINADKTGVDSTGANDKRITAVGHFIRRYKLDELSQLWNVLIGDMSLVGPRPNVERETNLYTLLERRLLEAKPGITDFASIVFSDEGDILKDAEDPDLAYNQLIRPWKSRLGLVYVENQNLFLDIRLIILTVIAIISRPLALQGVHQILLELNTDPQLCEIALRKRELYPCPPPGSNEIVMSR